MIEKVIQGNRPGKTLLITAGMDGDEYASMEAAFALIKKYASGNFAGRLIIVPIVNLPGFAAECSINPQDGRFPKLVFPGSASGTPTERMVSALVTKHAFQSDAWFDMHCAALTERVRPFVWAFETGNDAVDAQARQFVETCGAGTTVVERARWRSKARVLAARGCMYVIAESGDRGLGTAADVARHVQWAERLMAQMEMIAPLEPSTQGSVQLLHHVSYAVASSDGLWRPAEFTHEEVTHGQPLGVCARLDGSREKTITAPVSGVPLWWKETLSMRRGDILMAIGRA